jgi:hypothetical protein
VPGFPLPFFSRQRMAVFHGRDIRIGSLKINVQRSDRQALPVQAPPLMYLSSHERE